VQHSSFYLSGVILVLLPTIALVGCGGGCEADPTAPECPETEQGTVLRIDVSTTGDDFDLNGYLLFIDQDTTLSGSNSSSVRRNLAAGDHTLRLDDVADNCSISGPASRTVALTEGDTSEVVFAVTCTALPPATVDVSGTWIGESTEISTLPGGSVAMVTYVLQQTGDSVTVSSRDWVGPNGGFPSVGVGRVSGSTFTLFVIVAFETRLSRMTSVHTVSGNQMAGSSTEQLGPFTETLAMTKQ
jgi:hypothetical protein